MPATDSRTDRQRQSRTNSSVSTLPAPPGTDTSKTEGPSERSQREEDEELLGMDFGFLPIPSRARYDPKHPAHFGLAMNALFGLASTFIVANLYYCQPLLIQFADSFGVTEKEVSTIPTLVQAGYAVGLLFISPLGDLVRRRPLILLLNFITGSLTIGLAITTNLAAFEVLCFFVGVCTVVPQILMPLAVDLAPPERRASALSIVLSGLLFGVLIARVLSGVVAQFVTWRVVYFVSIGVQFGILALLYWMLPDYPAKNKGATYFGILFSMGKFCVTEPLLVQAILITIPSSATFSGWWVTLTFLLGGDPYNYSTVVIGLFGLVGMVGVAMAPLIGRTIDNLVPWSATLVAIVALVATFAVQTAAAGLSVAAVVIVCIGLDVFRQTQQVSLTSAVLGLDAAARSRLNAVLILSLFIGQVMGTSVSAQVFTQHGWRPTAALNLAWTGWGLFVLFLRGPHCPRYTWIGWQGGWELRKSVVDARTREEKERTEQGVVGTDGAEAEDRKEEPRVSDVPVRDEKKGEEAV
ncbi:MFS general substrate transporter [Epithele typhae]|uniref:MFS general substrate transporter n=1 Tax=Epithele typhae TaxID=378194 RepID=UPI0020085439|nr:MFS general substrate transporter [Epithele typhae]KAH9919162.1 MFS general substrate transporter [Epithele typhae]